MSSYEINRMMEGTLNIREQFKTNLIYKVQNYNDHSNSYKVKTDSL